MRRCAVLFALLLALALPGASLAQSAGDNQYYDPLAGSNPSPHHAPAQGTQQPSSSAPAAAPQQPAQTSQQPTTAPQTSSQSSGNQLPRTGFPALLLAVMGAGFLLTGGTLRRGAAEPEVPEPPGHLQGGRLTRSTVRRFDRRRRS